MDNKTKIIETIQNLLARTTDRGCSENEARAAAMHAGRLMMEHNINMSHVEGHQRESDEMGFKHQWFGIDYNRAWEWAAKLGIAVADLTLCRMSWNARGMKRATFWGAKEDVQIAALLFEFFVDYGKRLVKQYWYETLTPEEKKGRSYLATEQGFLEGYTKGLITSVGYEIQKRMSNQEEWGLVVHRQGEADSFMRSKINAEGHEWKGNRPDPVSYEAGYEKGKNTPLEPMKPVEN